MRLIDADVLKEAFKAWKAMDDYYHNTDCNDIPFSEAFDLIDNTPSIIRCGKTSDGLPLMDLRPRPQGEWKIGGKTTHYHYCSICGKDGDIQDNFCRNCGADMRGAK